ncbi:MAG: PAS domain S-box protein, partial [Chloroflexi bacterium]
MQGEIMLTPELPSQERSDQLRALLSEIRNQIRNLPDVYQQPLAGSLDRLTGLLEVAGHTSGQPPAIRRSASLDVPTEPAYLFARDLPVPVMRQMEIVLDNLDSAIFVFDKSGTIRRANARARAMLGTELVGMSTEKFYSQFQVYTAGEQPLDLTNCPVGRASRGETVSREAIRVYIPGGRAYSILASAIPIEVNNQFTGVVSVWSDVTELERLTGQIEAERDQLKTILESISDEVWYADQDWNIRLMNEQAARGLGIENPEAINQGPVEALLDELEIFNPDGSPRPHEETPLLHSLRGETNRGQEIVRNKRTGQTMVREYTSAPVRSRGRVVGAVAVIRDITRQKRQEQDLRESELRERARAAELYALMNAVPAVIFVTHDPQARLVTGNRMAHELMRVGEGHNF